MWAAPLLREGGAEIRNVGLGILDGRLVRRLEVRNASVDFPTSSFVLHVDTSTAEPLAVVGPSGGAPRVELGDRRTLRGGLVVPSRLDFYDEARATARRFRIERVAINEVIDDGLFTAGSSRRDLPAETLPPRKGIP
jgi:hypothetical protein